MQFFSKKQSLHLVQMNAHNILFEWRMSCISSSEDLTSRSRVCFTSPYHFACTWAVHVMVYVKEKEFHSWASFYFLNNIFTKTLTLSTNNITLTTRNNIILKLFVLVKLLVWWILADKSHVEQVTFKRLRLKSTQIID